jgi:hypothetical protein
MRFAGRLPTWDAQWPPTRLRKQHETIGDRAWEQGYQCRPYTSADRLFQHASVVWTNGAALHVPDPIPGDWVVFSGVDLSGPTRPGNVITTIGISPEHIRMILDVQRIQGGSPAVADAVCAVWRRWLPAVVMVEDNGYQTSLIEWVQKSAQAHPWWDRIQPHTTTGNKRSTQIGLPGLDIEFRNGAWVFPGSLTAGHDVGCECGPCWWVREFKSYPQGATSDCVMSTWFASRAAAVWIQAQHLIDGDDEVHTPDDIGRIDWSIV